MAETIADMTFAPKDLAARLNRVFRVPPDQALLQLRQICVETLDLVDAHVPGFDTAEYRANLRQHRGAWDALSQ
jgi:hypothetical protein